MLHLTFFSHVYLVSFVIALFSYNFLKMTSLCLNTIQLISQKPDMTCLNITIRDVKIIVNEEINQLIKLVAINCLFLKTRVFCVC